MWPIEGTLIGMTTSSKNKLGSHSSEEDLSLTIRFSLVSLFEEGFYPTEGDTVSISFWKVILLHYRGYI